MGQLMHVIHVMLFMTFDFFIKGILFFDLLESRVGENLLFRKRRVIIVLTVICGLSDGIVSAYIHVLKADYFIIIPVDQINSMIAYIDDAVNKSVCRPHLPELVVAPVEGVLKHDAFLFNLAFADIDDLSAKGIDDLVARMGRKLLHPELLIGLSAVVFLHYPRPVLF
jgi:hypothetical protein